MEKAEISVAGDINEVGSVPQATKSPKDHVLQPLQEDIISTQEVLLPGEDLPGDPEKGGSTFDPQRAFLRQEPRSAYLNKEEDSCKEVQISTESAQVGQGRKGNSHEEFQSPQVPPCTYPKGSFCSQSEADTKELHQTTLTPKPAPLFRQAKISIAVDVSGSTYGNVIEKEVKAIRSICSLFPSSLAQRSKYCPGVMLQDIRSV
jgi:hypothetical protein